MSRLSFDSLKIQADVDRNVILYKDAQAAIPGSGIQPEMGQDPVTGNADEMQAPESANQRQFEDDFGSLAYQFVQDRAPALIPYMLGFEVVDRNEDGSKAVGIFGYKVDEDFYYIPAFFLNNQVRGVDMMLNKKTNQFVPLTENWIDYVVNKHSIRIGSPASTEVRDTMRNPDLSFVQRPQTGIGKLAEDNEPWSFSEAWNQIKEATARLIKDPAFQEMLSGAASNGDFQKAAESTYFKTFMEKVGGPECMTRFIKELNNVDFANAALTLYKDAEAFWTENLVNASVHVDRMKKIAASRPKVRIVDSVKDLTKVAKDTPASDVGDEDKALTEEENARQIVEHDFTIEDNRSDDETSQITDDAALVDFEHRFQPPSGPGKYNFMMADGMSREGVLLNTVISPSCDKDDQLVVFNDNGNVLAQVKPCAIITTEFEEDSNDIDNTEVFKDLYDKAKDIPDIEVGSGNESKPYIFIDDKGNAAGPFYIRFTIVDGDHVRLSTGYGSGDVIVTSAKKDGLSTWYGFMDWDLTDRYHDENGRPKLHNMCCDGCSSNEMISLGTFSGMPKTTGAGIIMPKNWKALPVRRFYSYAPYPENEGKDTIERRTNDARYAEERDNAISKYTFGSAMDILEDMRSEGVARIKVASDGIDYSVTMDGANVKHGPMNYKTAAVDLVTRFGFRPRRAFNTLNKIASSGSAMFLVKIPSLTKKAQDGLVNVSMPSPVEQIPSIDPYSGVPVYTSPYIDITQGQSTGIPALPPEGGLTRGINIGGEMERNMSSGDYPDEHNDSMSDEALPIDAQARQLAEDAAKAGQRHVFDQAAIGGLVKVYDTANVVDSYIPDFMDTIDRLGRILFLFYWKHEDFNQRYGSDDVVQMEDRLRNVFKQMGELTLSLKEKSVQNN